MKIGKYEIDAGASGDHQNGFKGHITRTWDDGNETQEQWHEFDEPFPTLDQAVKHAYEQAHLRVQKGDW
jgi:hypothetical protein